MTKDVVAHIEEVQQLVASLHTSKQLRAWASEENAETKKAIQLKLEQLRVLIKHA